MSTRDDTGGDETLDPIELGRLASGRGAKSPAPSRQRGSRGGNRGRHQKDASRPKRATAPEFASSAAQTWYDLGNRFGWEFPYDVNYLALEMDTRIQKDKFLMRIRERQGDKQGLKLLDKMADIWWREWVTEGVTARNAKETYLVDDWDHIRDYAHTSLRAAYLKVHGKRTPIKALRDEEQDPDYLAAAELRRNLDILRVNQAIEDMRNQPVVDRTPLDEAARERLRSFAERHGGKK